MAAEFLRVITSVILPTIGLAAWALFCAFWCGWLRANGWFPGAR